MCADAFIVSTFIEAVVTAFSMLGGAMAAVSGYRAAVAYWPAKAASMLTDEINRGIAIGFTYGAPIAALAAMIVFTN